MHMDADADEGSRALGDDSGVSAGDLDGLPNVDEDGQSAPDIDPTPDIDAPGVDEEEDPATRSWFLTPDERGNPASSIDRIPRDDGRGWVAGNRVRPLVHGATYFRRLYEELCALEKGDRFISPTGGATGTKSCFRKAPPSARFWSTSPIPGST